MRTCARAWLAVLPAAGLLALAVLGTAGPAAADDCVAVLCPTGSPSPSPSPSPTPTGEPTPPPTRTRLPTPHATPTVTSAPRATASRTAAPRPRVTTASSQPVDTVGTATPLATFTPLPAASPARPSADARLTKLIGLVVFVAVLLGAGGATGLYLTRPRP